MLHPQAPLAQVALLPQMFAHAPQSYGSVWRSTQALLQLISPVPQVVVHAPSEHTWLVPQATPQPLQFFGSLCTSVHTPAQRIPPL